MATKISERKITRYVATIRGIFGKNRREKFTSEDLIDVPEDAPKSIAELLPIFRAKIAELKVKPGAVVKLRSEPAIVEVWSDGSVHTLIEMVQ